MKSIDLPRLDDLCSQVVQELHQIGSHEAAALAQEVELRMETVVLVSEGDCLEPESVAALDGELASVKRSLSRQRAHAAAVFTKRGVMVAADASVDEVQKRLQDIGSGTMLSLLRNELECVDELQTLLQVHLAAARSAAAGPKDAMTRLEEALAKARKLIQQARKGGSGP